MLGCWLTWLWKSYTTCMYIYWIYYIILYTQYAIYNQQQLNSLMFKRFQLCLSRKLPVAAEQEWVSCLLGIQTPSRHRLAELHMGGWAVQHSPTRTWRLSLADHIFISREMLQTREDSGPATAAGKWKWKSTDVSHLLLTQVWMLHWGQLQATSRMSLSTEGGEEGPGSTSSIDTVQHKSTAIKTPE